VADFLSQEEIDSLMDINAGGGDIDSHIDLKSVEYVAFNFKRPNRISSDQVRTINYLHDKILRDLSSNFSSKIKKLVDIKLLPIDQMTYNEFTMSLPDETNFNILSLAPNEGRMAIESNPQFSRMVINYLMGAEKELKDGQVDIITELEINIFNHFLNIVSELLAKTWEPIAKMSYKIEAQDKNPHNTMLVASSDVVIIVVLEFTIEEKKGMLNLCYPKSFIEPLIASGAMGRIMAETKVKKTRNEDINSLLSGSKVTCEAIMTNTNFTVKDIISLKNDDTIVFNKPIETLKGRLKINNKDKFLIDFGVQNGKKSTKITASILEEHKETIKILNNIADRRENSRIAARVEMERVMREH
jgi:flagellar motor switch protein FliM